MAHAGIKIMNGTFRAFYFVNATAGEAFRMPAGAEAFRGLFLLRAAWRLL
jgi:hypothetical protein